MTRSKALGLALALICAACGDSSSPTAPTTDPSRVTVIFSGTLAPGDTQFYSFTVGLAGTTDVLLASLRPRGQTRPALSTTVGLGIGTPAGTGCRTSTSLNTQPGLSSQISTSTTATIYCASVYDVGNLTEPVDFTVRIVHP